MNKQARQEHWSTYNIQGDEWIAGPAYKDSEGCSDIAQVARGSESEMKRIALAMNKSVTSKLAIPTELELDQRLLPRRIWVRLNLDGSLSAFESQCNQNEFEYVRNFPTCAPELLEALERIESQICEVKSHGDYFAQALQAEARQAIAKGQKTEGQHSGEKIKVPVIES